jgi:zinc/manganese transport system permease protein
VNPVLEPDLLTDLRELVQFGFMRSALEAGTIVAILAAVVGWYVVLRRQAFAAHTLSVMAFPGAAGAALAGLPTALGYYVACVAAAAVIGPSSGPRRRAIGGESATIGTVQTVGLAAGFLFLSLDQTLLGEPDSLLFGTFLGVTSTEVLVLLAVALGSSLALAAIARPLLFATVDRDLARASGVPVVAVELVFVLVLVLAIAATSQITGALLVFALLIAPPAAAQRLTGGALLSLALSVLFALVIVWLGLALAYFTVYPAGFYVTTLAMALFVIVRVIRR